jgi:hypothetical protein
MTRAVRRCVPISVVKNVKNAASKENKMKILVLLIWAAMMTLPVAASTAPPPIIQVHLGDQPPPTPEQLEARQKRDEALKQGAFDQSVKDWVFGLGYGLTTMPRAAIAAWNHDTNPEPYVQTSSAYNSGTSIGAIGGILILIWLLKKIFVRA